MRSSALRTKRGAGVARLILACALLAAAPAPRAIDAAKSSAQFSVAHIWVERVTGTVPILSGGVSLEPGSVIPQSATAVLDATHITTGEPDRDRSLESPDFFDAAKFPQWTFTSTRIVPKGPATFEMDGDLTIHGVTRSERLDVTAIGDPAHPEYRAKAQIDRHAFGMTRTRLDPTIGTIVDITLDIVLK
jgi:polyisoprenoid-binding protein YceI